MIARASRWKQDIEPGLAKLNCYRKRNEPASFWLAGSRSCASYDQDGDEEEEKASERAGLVAAEVEQRELDPQR
jgi:hypothetical protein